MKHEEIRTIFANDPPAAEQVRGHTVTFFARCMNRAMDEHIFYGGKKGGTKMSKGKNRIRMKTVGGKHIVYVWDVSIDFTDLRSAWQFIGFINRIGLKAG